METLITDQSTYNKPFTGDFLENVSQFMDTTDNALPIIVREIKEALTKGLNESMSIGQYKKMQAFLQEVEYEMCGLGTVG